jgi:hypothetical protein
VKKQRAAIIVRQCPAASKGHERYKSDSTKAPVHEPFRAVLFKCLKTFGCHAATFDALIPPTKGSSSRPLHNGGNRQVVNTKHNTSGLSGNACAPAQALSSKTFDLNLCRFGRSVRESPVSPGASISSLSISPARDESKRIGMRLPVEIQSRNGRNGAKTKRNLWNCS